MKILEQARREQIPHRRYPHADGGPVTIVSFDVPERDRRKRNWLRSVLLALGFTPVHKSVFIGRVKVPPELIEDLYQFKLVESVEIFEVTKLGTLRHVTQN